MVPNYPFSVILDVENNPYLRSGGRATIFGSRDEDAPQQKIQDQLTKAADYVDAICNQQKELFNKISNDLLKEGLTLQDVFQKQYKFLGIEEEDESQPLEDEITKIKRLQEKLQKDGHAVFTTVKQATRNIAKVSSVEELASFTAKASQSASEYEQTLVRAYNSIKDIEQKNRMIAAKLGAKKGLDFSYKDGELAMSFEDKTLNKKEEYARLLKFIELYLKLLQEILAEWKKNSMNKRKGNTYFPALGEKRGELSSNKGFWASNDPTSKELQTSYEVLRRLLDNKLSEVFTKETTSKILSYVRLLALGKEPDDWVAETRDGDKAIISASSFGWEEGSAYIINDLIREALIDGEADSTVLNQKIRMQFVGLPLASQKEEALEALYKTHDELSESMKKLFSANTQLDKIDSYTTIKHVEKDGKESKILIAFSDKLYYDLSRIDILKGKSPLITEEGKKMDSDMTNLINTYDILSQAKIIADDFMFAVLNGANASGLKGYYTEETLERWLSTFVYEIAFNPKSFVQYILNTIKDNIDSNNVLYVLNAGAKIAPAFEILEKLHTFLTDAETSIGSCVQTKIQVDEATKASEVLRGAEEATNYKGGKYSPEAWSYVANQVAQNTLMSVYLNLLELVS